MSSDNKLRPYYDHDTFNAGYSVIFRPGVGLVDTQTDKPITASLASAVADKTTGNRSFASGKTIGLSGFSQRAVVERTASGDKNYVYDLEIQEYFDFSNLSELLKNLMWNFFKNYCKVLVSQPLEIARLVLQVGYFDTSSKPANKGSKKYSRLLRDTSSTQSTPQITDISESESDSEIDFFQPTSESASIMKPKPTSGKTLAPKKSAKNLNKIQPISKHTIDIMTAVASKDGPFALFRGINAQFIHQTLSHTIEAWITGFMSPFLGIPDPFFLDLTHLTDPLKSLWLSVLACVLTGLILMPLDLIKVRLMITQFNKPALDSPINLSQEQSPESPPSTALSTSSTGSLDHSSYINTRSIRESIRYYPVGLLLLPPPTITLLTVLHQFSTSVFRKTAPYLIFIRFNLDSYSSPNLYTLLNLNLLIMEFFIKLPVENLLRKEQVRFLLQPKSLEEDEKRVVTIDNPDEDLIVNYNGWDLHHIDDEGSVELREETGLSGFMAKVRRLHLFDGWRVGVLNVVGFWGYNIFKTNSTHLKQEKL